MDIHAYSGLSYNSHLILDPEFTGHLPTDWHRQMSIMLDQLTRAFPGVNRDNDITLALRAEPYECGDLTEEQLRLVDMSRGDGLDDHDSCEHPADEDENFWCEHENMRWYDWRGDEYEADDRVMVPLETEEQARQADRIVISRTLLQSMPEPWQHDFVALAGRAEGGGSSYELRFYTADGHRTTDPIPHYQRGRTYIEPLAEVLA